MVVALLLSKSKQTFFFIHLFLIKREKSTKRPAIFSFFSGKQSRGRATGKLTERLLTCDTTTISLPPLHNDATNNGPLLLPSSPMVSRTTFFFVPWRHPRRSGNAIAAVPPSLVKDTACSWSDVWRGELFFLSSPFSSSSLRSSSHITTLFHCSA